MRCLAKTKRGHRCKRKATAFDLCRQHRRVAWRDISEQILTELAGIPTRSGWIRRPLDMPDLTPDAIVRLKGAGT